MIRSKLLLIGMLAAMAAGGVGSTWAAGSSQPVTVQQGRALKFTSARARGVEGGTLVAGTVRRALGHSAPRHSHIAISVQDAQGHTVHSTVTDTLPKPLRTGRHASGKGRFAAKLPMEIPAGGKVVVRHQTL